MNERLSFQHFEQINQNIRRSEHIERGASTGVVGNNKNIKLEIPFRYQKSHEIHEKHKMLKL